MTYLLLLKILSYIICILEYNIFVCDTYVRLLYYILPLQQLLVFGIDQPLQSQIYLLSLALVILSPAVTRDIYFS